MKRLNISKYLSILLVLLIGSCSRQNTGTGHSEAQDGKITEQTEKEVPVIDLLAYDKDDAVGVEMQRLGTVEYIILELTDSSLISSSPLTVTDDYIIARNKEGNVIFFNRDGSFSHAFNHKGAAGFEYPRIDCMAVMPTSNDVFVGDISKDIIQQYDVKGNYIRTIKLPYRHSQRFYIYDDSTLLVHDRRFMTNESHRKKYGVNPHPLYLVNIENSNVTELSFQCDNPTVDGLSYEAGSMVHGYNLYVPQLAKEGDKIIISEALQDTVFCLSGMNLSPMVIKNNTTYASGHPILTTIDGLSNRYLLLYIQEKQIDLAHNTISDPILLIYDYSNHSVTNAVLTNRDGLGKECEQYYINRMSGAIHTLPSGYMAQLLESEYILNLREEGRLSGKLLEVANRMNEESNPLLILLYLN